MLLLLALLFMCARADLLLQQHRQDDDGRTINSTRTPQINGCTLSISLQIKPCFCKEIVRKRNVNKTSTISDVILQGTWIYCKFMDLGDDRISHILRTILSSELNRNFTRRIDLMVGNQLTKIPSEIYQFKRLQKVNLASNKILMDRGNLT